MKRISLLALFLLVGCDSAMTAHWPDDVQAQPVEQSQQSVPRCCAYFESPSPAQGACWLCGEAIVCAGEHAVCPDELPTCTGDEIRQQDQGAVTYGTDLTQCAFACQYIAAKLGESDPGWCR